MRKRIMNPNKPKSKGEVKIYAEEKFTNNNTEICIFRPSAIVFKLGKATYFFMIFKSFKGKAYTPIYRSEM